MELRQIRYFLGVAHELNFSRAAEKLNIVQPALSRQIQQLEEQLGFRLFERDKRNVQLTPAGYFLKKEWELWLGRLDDTCHKAERISRGQVGELRIGYPGSALYSILPEVLALVRERLPEVEAKLSEVAELDLIGAIGEGLIDVGFTREWITDPFFEIKNLFEEPMALVVPESHPLNERTFIDIEQCRHELFILPSMPNNLQYRQRIYGLFAEANYLPKVVFESNYGATILRLVEKQLGVSILPISYRLGSSLKLRFIPLSSKTQLHLMWRRDDNNPVLLNFLKLCNEAVTRLHLNF
jgi:LysR family transcriptional regulator, benzoate and cis,cis-muconate-responsive activator of ben and cat genes